MRNDSCDCILSDFPALSHNGLTSNLCLLSIRYSLFGIAYLINAFTNNNLLAAYTRLTLIMPFCNFIISFADLSYISL
eukprot:GAHX01006326.1.p1 GENE.GAHX01006326.1~~GAHX01006326.1.p1  ORF type:complete len:78 (+),score=0.27 GAHX01006326.1:341-574(+)